MPISFSPWPKTRCGAIGMTVIAPFVFGHAHLPDDSQPIERPDSRTIELSVVAATTTTTAAPMQSAWPGIG